MFAVGNFAAKVPMPMAPAQQPPGFFGGPRVATPHVSVFEPPKYEFLKSECNSGTSSTEHSAGETFTKTEDLTDEILEGAADLFDLVGRSIQVFLRDGRLIMGELASVDHFHNLVIFGAAERIIIGKQYADMPRQVEVIRGDNLIMIGEIDGERESEFEDKFEHTSFAEILEAQKLQKDEAEAKQQRYQEGLKQRGVSFPRPLDDDN